MVLLVITLSVSPLAFPSLARAERGVPADALLITSALGNGGGPTWNSPQNQAKVPTATPPRATSTQAVTQTPKVTVTPSKPTATAPSTPTPTRETTPTSRTATPTVTLTLTTTPTLQTTINGASATQTPVASSTAPTRTPTARASATPRQRSRSIDSNDSPRATATRTRTPTPSPTATATATLSPLASLTPISIATFELARLQVTLSPTPLAPATATPSPTPSPTATAPSVSADEWPPSRAMNALGASSFVPAIPSSPSSACGRAFQYWEPLELAARAAGANPEVIAALLVVEGSGERAVSYAGAMGLMQLMPDKFRPGDDPFDVPTNFRRAAEHIAYLHGIYGSSERVAAAYFGAVDRFGNITGASDGNVNGFEYVGRFQSAAACIQAGLGMPGTVTASLVSPIGGPITRNHISFGFLDDYGHALAQLIRGVDGIGRYGTRHLAWDLIIPGAPNNGRGLPAFAPISGRVIQTNDPIGGPFGLWIENPDLDLRVRLMHMDRLAPSIQTGATVRAGQWVGAQGGQGTESFPHLHLSIELLSTGERLDPARFYFRPAAQPLVATDIQAGTSASQMIGLGASVESARRSLASALLGPVEQASVFGNLLAWRDPIDPAAPLQAYDADLGWTFSIPSMVDPSQRPLVSEHHIVWLSPVSELEGVGRSNSNGVTQIHAFDLTTGLQNVLTRVPGAHSSLALSGSRVAWISESGNLTAIHVTDLTTGTDRVIAWSMESISDLSLSGSLLVYRHHPRGDTSNTSSYLRLVDLEANTLTTVAEGAVSQPVVLGNSVAWLQRVGSRGDQIVVVRDVPSGQWRVIADTPIVRDQLTGSDHMLIWEEFARDGTRTLRRYGLTSDTQAVIDARRHAQSFNAAVGNGTIVWQDEQANLVIASLSEWDIPEGRFFAETSPVVSGAGRPGQSITNVDGIPLWDEYQRLGGPEILGRPITGRLTLSDGLVYQVMERALIQWQPDLQHAVLGNVMEMHEQYGQNDWLYHYRQIPQPAQITSLPDAEAARAERLNWLQDPLILFRFLANPAPTVVALWNLEHAIELYGLPMSPPEDFGPFIAQRFQRAVFQRWKHSSDSPPEPDDVVTQVPVGRIFKELVIDEPSE
ncbi:MAG: transglycosylase SLT domain-containing protein [Chloroflexota bacterium]